MNYEPGCLPIRLGQSKWIHTAAVVSYIINIYKLLVGENEDFLDPSDQILSQWCEKFSFYGADIMVLRSAGAFCSWHNDKMSWSSSTKLLRNVEFSGSRPTEGKKKARKWKRNAGAVHAAWIGRLSAQKIIISVTANCHHPGIAPRKSEIREEKMPLTWCNEIFDI